MSLWCVGKNSGSFDCKVFARALWHANVPECAVGILFLSLVFFTVVVFLALAVTEKVFAKGGLNWTTSSISTERSKLLFQITKLRKKVI